MGSSLVRAPHQKRFPVSHRAQPRAQDEPVGGKWDTTGQGEGQGLAGGLGSTGLRTTAAPAGGSDTAPGSGLPHPSAGSGSGHGAGSRSPPPSAPDWLDRQRMAASPAAPSARARWEHRPAESREPRRCKQRHGTAPCRPKTPTPAGNRCVGAPTPGQQRGRVPGTQPRSSHPRAQRIPMPSARQHKGGSLCSHQTSGAQQQTNTQRRIPGTGPEHSRGRPRSGRQRVRLRPGGPAGPQYPQPYTDLPHTQPVQPALTSPTTGRRFPEQGVQEHERRHQAGAAKLGSRIQKHPHSTGDSRTAVRPLPVHSPAAGQKPAQGRVPQPWYSNLQPHHGFPAGEGSPSNTRCSCAAGAVQSPGLCGGEAPLPRLGAAGTAEPPVPRTLRNPSEPPKLSPIHPQPSPCGAGGGAPALQEAKPQKGTDSAQRAPGPGRASPGSLSASPAPRGSTEPVLSVQLSKGTYPGGAGTPAPRTLDPPRALQPLPCQNKGAERAHTGRGARPGPGRGEPGLPRRGYPGKQSRSPVPCRAETRGGAERRPSHKGSGGGGHRCWPREAGTRAAFVPGRAGGGGGPAPGGERGPAAFVSPPLGWVPPAPPPGPGTAAPLRLALGERPRLAPGSRAATGLGVPAPIGPGGKAQPGPGPHGKARGGRGQARPLSCRGGVRLPTGAGCGPGSPPVPCPRAAARPRQRDSPWPGSGGGVGGGPGPRGSAAVAERGARRGSRRVRAVAAPRGAGTSTGPTRGILPRERSRPRAAVAAQPRDVAQGCGPTGGHRPPQAQGAAVAGARSGASPRAPHQRLALGARSRRAPSPRPHRCVPRALSPEPWARDEAQRGCGL
ncbi:collagen alpha-1(I) chain-like [Pezoporus wallicus]|uniref:collagen alpha-1(I) chain-like n=1 Tax=Pezoporus wallicus TaxID=35540 RepID=UPI00254C10A1|nr:collagen alpha-1(I) chain-like [Pezoporus wallicus]